MTNRRGDLFEAVKLGTPELVRALVLTGADIDEKTAVGESVLQTAVKTGRPDIIKVLSDLGADITERESRNNFNLLEWLLFTVSKKRHEELQDKEYSVVFTLVKYGLRIGDSSELIAARQDSPGIFDQTDVLIMNVQNLKDADTDQSVSTGFEFDI